MIVVMFIVLMFNYILMPFLFTLPELNDFGALYIVLVPTVIWFFGILAGGVFWYYKRKLFFWLNIAGLIGFYAPLIQFYLK